MWTSSCFLGAEAFGGFATYGEVLHASMRSDPHSGSQHILLCGNGRHDLELYMFSLVLFTRRGHAERPCRSANCAAGCA
jgi:hypothetical protein